MHKPILPGYDVVSTIHLSEHSRVYRAVRLRDNLGVVIKQLMGSGHEELNARLNREFQYVSSFDTAGIVRVLGIEQSEVLHALVFEDTGGRSLDLELAGGTLFSISQCLAMATDLCSSLALIHRQGVVHKDLNPANMLYSDSLKIIDFGISGLLGVDRPRPGRDVEGTLTHIAPEQTGRLDLPIDHRADFYSLGVTLYQLLGHRLPFQVTDPLELLHCHLASVPTPLHDLEPSIPEPLSLLVARLLAKDPDERYQSAAGLLADLQHCRDQYDAHKRIDPFELGLEDVPEILNLPGKLYGKQAEQKQLIAELEMLWPNPGLEPGRRRPQLVVISGSAGVGKSTLARSLREPVREKHGFLATGKFDQHLRHTPYRALVEAIADLVGQLHLESTPRQAAWRARLRKQVGRHAGVLVPVFPALDVFFDDVPPIVELGATETHRRFQFAFRALIGCLCQRGHPLVFQLDDLHWADMASLNLLRELLKDETLPPLLIVATYRHEEVDPFHPLSLTLERLEREGDAIRRIQVRPLGTRYLRELIGDALGWSREESREMAHWLYEISAGNPFFAYTLLERLNHKGLLWFDQHLRRWQWTQARWDALEDGRDVVALLREKMEELPMETRELLLTGACLGNQFYLDHLALGSQRDREDTRKHLQPAIEAKLLYALDGHDELRGLPTSYRFPHDHVHKAAWRLAGPKDRAEHHGKIAMALLEHLPGQTRDHLLFALVDHLNMGEALEPMERANWNLEAGRRAKLANNQASAQQFLELGLALLPAETRWQEHPERAFALMRELAEVNYLAGETEKALALVAELLGRAQDIEQKLEVYQMLVVNHTMAGNLKQAIDAGIEGLALLDIHLTGPQALDPEREIEAITTSLSSLSCDDLTHGALMSAASRAKMKLLISMGPANFLSNQDLWVRLVVRAVRLTLEEGVCPESSYAFAGFGQVLSEAAQPNYELAYDLARLGMGLYERFGQPDQGCMVALILGGFILHWKRPIREAEPVIAKGYSAALAGGNTQYAGYLIQARVCNFFYQGKPLGRVLVEINNLLPFARQTGNRPIVEMLAGVELVLKHLSARDGSLDFQERPQGEGAFLAQMAGNKGAVVRYETLKVLASLIHGRHQHALVCCRRARAAGLHQLGGTMFHTLFYFYEALALAGVISESSAPPVDRRERFLENLARLERWSRACPENYLNAYLLVSAEKARLEGCHWEAAELYEAAAEAAKQWGFLGHEALIHLLAGNFWQKRKMERQAVPHYKEALVCFRRWGSIHKVAELEQALPHDRGVNWSPGIHDFSPFTTQSNSGTYLGDVLDRLSLMKAVRIISAEIEQPALARGLLKVAMESCGADYGCLILNQDPDWEVVASARLGGPFQLEPVKLEHYPHLPRRLVEHVRTTEEAVVLRDVRADAFAQDAYFLETPCRAVMAMPFHHHDRFCGVLYLENRQTVALFNEERQEVVHLLLAQAAVSLENVRLFERLRDSTAERKQAERDRDDSETRFAQFMKNQTGLVYIHDSQERLVYLNEAFEQVLGVGGRAWRGRTLGELVPNETVAQFHIRELNPARYGKHYKFSLTLEGPGRDQYFVGTRFPIERLGQTALVGGILLDATELHHARESFEANMGRLELVVADRTIELEQANQVMKILLNTIPHGVFWKDRNSTFLGCNENLARDAGLESPEQIIGKTDYQMPWSKEESDFFRKVDQEVMGNDAPMLNIEEPIHTADGTMLTLLTSKVPIKNTAGEVTGILGTYVDITHLKQQEFRLKAVNEAILENQERLVAQEKMASLGTLSAGIAHDIRGPLNFIEGLAEISYSLVDEVAEFLEGIPQPEEVAEALADLRGNLGVIHKHGVRASRVVHNVMQMARGGTGEKEPTDLDELVREHVAFCKSYRGLDGLVFEEHYGKVGEMLVIPTDLGRVVVNLVNNACDALARRQEQFTELEPRITIETRRLSEEIQITVADNGSGIDPAHLETIFEPFFTTKPTGKGNIGLGLAMCHDIITSGHGGKLSVTSHPGTSTKFTVHLPLPDGLVSAPGE